MAYIEGEQRSRYTLFRTTLDELIPEDHCFERLRVSLFAPHTDGIFSTE